MVLVSDGLGPTPRHLIGVPGAVVRRLAPDDSMAEMTDLLHRAYAELREMGLHYVASHQDEARTRARAANGECYVGVLDGRLIATVTFTPAGRTAGCRWYDRGDVASFSQLAVDLQWQRRGIGAALVRLSEERARCTGAAEISLDTSEKAYDLRTWYRRQGYRFVQTTRWSEVNYRSVIMSKRLV